MAYPELVRALLIPRNRSFGSIDLDAEAIFSAGGNLARSHRAASAIPHAENDCAEILRLDWGFDVIFRAHHFVREGLDGALGLFARLVKCLKIRA